MYINVIDKNNQPHKLPLKRLVCIESKNRKLHVCSLDGDFIIPSTIEEFLSIIGDSFTRAEKFKIINVDLVTHIDKGYLYFKKFKGEIIVSRRNAIKINRMLENSIPVVSHNR